VKSIARSLAKWNFSSRMLHENETASFTLERVHTADPDADPREIRLVGWLIRVSAHGSHARSKRLARALSTYAPREKMRSLARRTRDQ